MIIIVEHASNAKLSAVAQPKQAVFASIEYNLAASACIILERVPRKAKFRIYGNDRDSDNYGRDSYKKHLAPHQCSHIILSFPNYGNRGGFLQKSELD